GRDQRSPAIDGLLSDAAAGVGIRTINDGWYSASHRPWLDLADVSTERVRHATSGLQLTVRPVGAFTMHVTAGVDAGTQSSRDDFSEPIANGAVFTQLGRDRERLTQYTAGVDGTLSEAVSSLVRSRLTVGVAYLDTHYSDS